MIEMCNMCHLYKELNECGMCEKCDQGLINDYEKQKQEDIDTYKAIVVEGLR